MLADILPAQVRKIAYVVYALGVVALGVAAIVLDGMDLDPEWPEWFDIASQVWLYLGGAVGAVAAGNTLPRHRADA